MQTFLLTLRRAPLRRSYNIIPCGCHTLVPRSRYHAAAFNGYQSTVIKNDKNQVKYDSWTRGSYYKKIGTFNFQPVNHLSVSIDPGSTVRFFHTSLPQWEKSSSKVEETVKSLKEKETEVQSIPKPVEKKSLKQKVIAEILHYYHGFRLLFIDIKISSNLCWRMLKGHALTRREHKLLIRTVGDMFRLVPFSIFIIVPFMEFLLPFFIKFFPGMLPSTFQTAKDTEEKIKQSLKVKIEMAKFLQETLDTMAVQHKDHNSELAKDFTEWFHKVRKTGEFVSSEDIMKYSKLFEDELTLDALSPDQIVALCRVLDLQTFGNVSFLRFLLRMKLRHLIADDKMIQKEGIDSLDPAELQQACRARGMRAYGVPNERLRRQLNQWLDLSLNKKVPHSLLLLSRALMLPEFVPTEDQLKATISALPENLVTQTEAAIGEKEGKIDNKVRLEVLKEEERKMREERAEQAAAEQLMKKEKLEQIEELIDKAPTILESVTVPLTDPKKLTYTSEDINMLENALDNVSKEKKQLLVEKGELEDLKEEMADYKEDVQELREVTAETKVVKESKAAKLLYNKVSKMIGKIEEALGALEKKESELKANLELRQKDKSDELIHIDDLIAAIKKLTKVPDDARMTHIKQVLSKIDNDQDGAIKVDDVLKVIELIGKEDVQLNSEQIDEIIKLIGKEELLELQDKIEKTLKDSGDAGTIQVKIVKPNEGSKKKADDDKKKGGNGGGSGSPTNASSSAKSDIDVKTQSGPTPLDTVAINNENKKAPVKEM